VGLEPEPPEPRAEKGGVPVLLIAFLVLLLYWGDMYVLDHGADVMGKAGSFPPMVYDPFKTYKELEDHNPRSEIDIILAEGKRLFEANCAACHQSTGSGNSALNVPPLAGSEWVLAPGPGRAIRIILNSVRGPIQVKGTVYDNPAMPPWRTLLSDSNIAAILTYIRMNKEWGHNGSVVKPEKVKEARDLMASKDDQWTAPELLLVPESD
jgi:mono/diheme cytochrome c family protein